MSMLAEPRRKQRIINLRAKNNVWSNDNTKFGQRMLEKMGWSAGKGLGAKEDGIVEHIIARYKNDEKGLGYEDRNDQWTKHEDDFNSLLSELCNGSASEQKLHSGVSLELKSKKSKARVHYHKFTRGKDLSRYSEKDLACIFGKKILNNKDNVEKCTKEEIKVIDQVFMEKGSMEEYFKNKIILKNENTPSKDNVEDENDFAFHGFSGSTNSIEYENVKDKLGHQPFSFYSFTSTNSANIGCADGKDVTQNMSIHKEIKKKEKIIKKNFICEINSGNNVEYKQRESLQLNSHNTDYGENNIQQPKKKNKLKASSAVILESVEKIKIKKKRKIEVPTESKNCISDSKKKKNNDNK